MKLMFQVEQLKWLVWCCLLPFANQHLAWFALFMLNSLSPHFSSPLFLTLLLPCPPQISTLRHDSPLALRVSPADFASHHPTDQAKFFSGYPAVFREVLGQYGGHLANVGVTVWPGSCGHGVIVPR